MPEELEKQLKPEEMVDLFAFLVLDKPPSDPARPAALPEPPRNDRAAKNVQVLRTVPAVLSQPVTHWP